MPEWRRAVRAWAGRPWGRQWRPLLFAWRHSLRGLGLPNSMWPRGGPR